MPQYPQEAIEYVREGNDIVSVVSQYVPLKKKGARHFGLCPFHRETTPSFSVSDDRQLYYCFGCGASGNVIGFIMRIENYGFVDAIKHLADRIHYTLPETSFSGNKEFYALKESLYEIHKKAARFYYNCLSSEEGRAATAYMDERQIAVGVRRKYGLGYSPRKRNALFTFLTGEGYSTSAMLSSGLVLKRNDSYYDRFNGRLMFPIFDLQNRITGFGGRILEKGEPKYLNSPDTPIFNKSQSLYSINIARAAKKDTAILVEGYMDVISLYQYGFKNAVAALGTAFNAEHVRQLKKICKSAVLLFDSDEAGQRAALRAIETLRGSGIAVSVLQLEGAKDPDEYLKRFGSDSFQSALDGAMPFVKFQISCAQQKYNLQNTEDRVQFTKEASAILAKLDNAIERDVYSKELLKIVDIDEQAVKQEISRQEQSIAVSDDAAAKRIRGRNEETHGKGSTKGIDDARRSVLHSYAVSSAFSEAIASHLKRDEFAVDIYMRLFDVITAERNRRNAVNPADLISFFEKPEEQQAVSNVFAAPQQFEDEEKALADQIKIIKLAYLNERIYNAVQNDITSEETQMLVEQRNRLNSQKFML